MARVRRRASVSVGALGVAALLDAALGEPPPRLHPVVAAGAYLEAVGATVPAGPPVRAVVSGAAGWLLGAGAAGGLGMAGTALGRRLPWPVAACLEGAALWPLFSARLLLVEVAGAERALQQGLDAGREQVGRICSRDTADLDEAGVRATALESLAENLTDSVVAPLLAYAVAGLPGAALYRFANTADAMWGYRDARWRHAGTVAARADDLLNLLPARLTAVLLAPGSLLLVRTQARLTPSPNGGWPMAALALRLGLRLGKPGVYLLNGDAPEPRVGDVDRGLRLTARAMLLALLLAMVAAAAIAPAAAAVTRAGSTARAAR